MNAIRIVFAIVMVTPCAAFAQEPAAILKHDGWVAAVAFSPDDKTLASAGADNVVRLWEVGAWKPKGVLKGHTDCVCALAFFKDGLMLATGSFDRTAKIWGGTPMEFTTKTHPGPVLAIHPFAGPGMAFALTGSTDGKVRIQTNLDTTVDFPLRHRSWVNSIAVSKENWAFGSSDGSVGLAHGEDKEKKFFLQGGAGEVRCVAFSPDGKLLAAGNRYHTVRVWDVETKKEVKTLAGHMSDVWSIAFSPDGKTLAAADTDWKKPSKVKLWDTATWKERGAIDVPGEILAIAYSPKGDWLAVGSWDRTVRVFSVK